MVSIPAGHVLTGALSFLLIHILVTASILTFTVFHMLLILDDTINCRTGLKGCRRDCPRFLREVHRNQVRRYVRSPYRLPIYSPAAVCLPAGLCPGKIYVSADPGGYLRFHALVPGRGPVVALVLCFGLFFFPGLCFCLP